MTRVAPLTARPESIDELDPTEVGIRTDIGVVYDMQALYKVPGALAAIDALVTALERNGDRVDTSVGTITMTRYADDTELRKHLADRQSRYDRGRDLYQAYLDTGTFPTYRTLWSFYLESEGIPMPTDEVDV
ncbi:hypothetical protein SEA_ZITCH_50 [Gordonia Phage Zitch]|uniref:Uncharacterized protein n=1 Tax=Gordonia Phage Zitch TaxID=2743909 RepID=A0A7G3VC48_9CAUD|nr:hypothetical protein J1774_gp50 [Gordonia Phage Zitch]QKY78496.1 hypothetical protein SEA_ZITCH_50 [Gordonia Phage Zitch]